jgi:hypothetical protein
MDVTSTSSASNRSLTVAVPMPPMIRQWTSGGGGGGGGGGRVGPGEPQGLRITLRWRVNGSWYYTRVQIGDQIRGPCVHSLVEFVQTEYLLLCRLTSTWPDPLTIEPAWFAEPQETLQGWLRESIPRPWHVLLEATLEADPRDLGEWRPLANLLDWLRQIRSVGRQRSRQVSFLWVDRTQLRAGESVTDPSRTSSLRRSGHTCTVRYSKSLKRQSG